MQLPAITETPSFLFGVLLGSLLLCIGLCLGLWFGRRMAMLYDVKSMDRDQLQHLLSGLFHWTNGFASDVSQYREVMDRISTELNPADVQTNDGQATKLMAQIVKANEQLQQRLNQAEAALQDQAEEITAYMCEARTDTLTELPNRRAFDDELSRRMAEWRRNETSVNVVILDIDRFKLFNDRFGHAAGDAVLVEVARVLNTATRESDVVARLGGEEFAVVLAGVEASKALSAKSGMRKAPPRARKVCGGWYQRRAGMRSTSTPTSSTTTAMRARFSNGRRMRPMPRASIRPAVAEGAAPHSPPSPSERSTWSSATSVPPASIRRSATSDFPAPGGPSRRTPPGRPCARGRATSVAWMRAVGSSFIWPLMAAAIAR